MGIGDPSYTAMPATRENLALRGIRESIAFRDNDKWKPTFSRLVTDGEAPAALAHLAKPGQE